ncbi:hypothetical protein MNBD_GAMMA25-2615 [hydrothermal vent metagenome]|uniref:Doubled CXXCH motif domain-containing protein n=1 Tax=hydrothermal vent metagenome TaxID=652676 RepID=A0A3B1AMX9_9ZZZZ
MKRTSLSFLLFAGILLSTLLILEKVTAISHPAHDANCVVCHLAGDNTVADNAHKLLSSQERICGACHEDALRLSHATGFTPNRVLPAEYPVDWKGDVTCSTCHDIHSGKPGLLRGDKRGRELCMSCHDSAFFAAMPDAGASIISNGHLNASTIKEPLGLDAFTIQCLGCHSSNADGGPPVDIDPRGLVRHAGGAVNHPVGASYAKASRYGGYRSPTQLSKKIMLPEGRIGCISCHQGYTQEHGKLVMSNQASRLCFECHDL